MTQPSSVRFVMEDRLQADLSALQISIDADQAAFEGQVNSKIAGISGQNYVINGAFDVWQRGVGPFTATGYCADRWKIDARTAMTVGQYTQPTDYYSGSNYTDSKYALEIYSTNATNSIQISQYFESSYVNSLRGYNLVLSFSMQCRDATAPTVYAAVGVSDIADSSTASFSNIASVANDAPSSWQRYEIPFSLGYDLTNIGVCVRFNIDNIALDEHIQITNVKLERGTAATPFTRAGGDLAGERVACQRYYFRLWPDATNQKYGTGQVVSTTAGYFIINFPVTMRVKPSALEQSGTAAHYAIVNAAGTIVACGSVPTFNNASVNNAQVNASSVYTAAGQASTLVSNNVLGYLGFSAEL